MWTDGDVADSVRISCGHGGLRNAFYWSVGIYSVGLT